MKFLRCCFGRSDHSPSSVSFHTDRSMKSDPIATIVNSTVDYPPDDPSYDRIPHHGRVQISNNHSDQVAPVTIQTTALQQPDNEDFSSLYATVDRSRKTSRRSTPPARSSVINEPIYQRNTNFREPTPHYEQVIVRESLRHRDQRLQSNGTSPVISNFFSNTQSDLRTTWDADIYAEIGNNSGSGTYYPPSTRFTDDSSERYATIVDPDERLNQSTNARPNAMQF